MHRHKINSKRRFWQIFGALSPNLYFKAFLGKIIYQGKLKGFCVPSLNCYACPLSTFACPIGSLQHFVSIRQFPSYILGYILLIGLFVGRKVCGFICPFGFIQDLLYKIKSFKWKIPYSLRWMKYFWLVVVTLLIPFWTGQPWFCKLCPAGGIEAGAPLVIFSRDIRALIGGLFYLKIGIIALFIFFSITIKRPFCSMVCPLGAIYSLFNKISAFGLKLDENKCTKCNICTDKCPMGLIPYEHINSIDCIRCMECVNACPFDAIESTFFGYGLKSKKENVPLIVNRKDE